MEQNDLTKLSLQELAALKDKWLEEAEQEKKFSRLKTIAETLGEDMQAGSGYKRLTVTAEHSQEIRVSYFLYSSKEVSVHIGEKLVALDSDDTEIYVPGYWESYVLPLYEIALEKIAAANIEAAERERLELIEELTLPSLIVAQAG